MINQNRNVIITFEINMSQKVVIIKFEFQTLFSLTREAAVQCGIIIPEFNPDEPAGIRNGGRENVWS